MVPCVDAVRPRARARPPLSTYVNFPHGINLMWNTSVLLPSLLMSPVTVIFGAGFSYNVLMTLAPVLSATFAYTAFRRWTGPMPALGGALVFGFSPYVVSQSQGHLAQTLIMSAPLMLIVLDRLVVVQSSKPWFDGLLLGLLAWVQLLTGEEVLALEAVTAAIALVVLYLLTRREARYHLGYALRGSIVAGAVFVVLSAPFLAVQFLGPYRVQNVHPPNIFVSDLLNFFVPTSVTQFAPAAALNISSHFTGNPSEQGAYIGIPLALFLALAVVLARRRLVTWVAMAVAAAAAVLSMGPTIHHEGYISHIDLPGYLLQKLPFFRNLLPDRFASMMTLGVALLVALGLNELGRLRRPAMVAGWALAGVGLVAIVPVIHFPNSDSHLYEAFDTGFSCPSGTSSTASDHPPVAVALPVVNELDLRWQAESKFCFVMPSDVGMTGTNSSDITSTGVLFNVGNPALPIPPMTKAVRAEAAQELRSLDIQEIVVDPETPASPPFTPQQQAELVAWVGWLVGQPPLQSDDDYITYVWKNLPPISAIASGNFGQVSGA